MMPPMMMVADRKMEPDHWTMRMIVPHRGTNRRRINNTCRVVHHRCGLIHHRLPNDDGLSVDHSRLRLHDHLLNWLLDHDWRRLVHHYGSGLVNNRRRLNINWRCAVNRLRLESFCQQQARSHACHHFSSGCPFFITGFHARDRCSQHSQRCRYH